MSDEQVMWRVQMHDDTQAFAELVRRWEEPIRRLGVRLLGDVHRAEDVAQEAFARVFTHRRDFDPAARFSTWLWRIAVNLCRDELRRRDRRQETSLDVLSAGGADGGGEGTAEWEVVSAQPGPAEATVRLARSENRALLAEFLKRYQAARAEDREELLAVLQQVDERRAAEAAQLRDGLVSLASSTGTGFEQTRSQMRLLTTYLPAGTGGGNPEPLDEIRNHESDPERNQP